MEYRNGTLTVQADCLEKRINLKVKKGDIALITGGTESTRSEILQRLFQSCKDCLSEIPCCYVPQQPVLFHDTVQENICFGEKYEENKFIRVIQAVDLLEDIGNFAEGMQKNVGKMGTAVSGGQRKRIGLARALYLKDAILFVDGLAEAVDKKTEVRFLSNMHLEGNCNK